MKHIESNMSESGLRPVKTLPNKRNKARRSLHIDIRVGLLHCALSSGDTSESSYLKDGRGYINEMQMVAHVKKSSIKN